MKTVFSYVKPYWLSALIAFILMLIELMIELVQPLIIAKIIDEGIVVNDFSSIQFWGIVLVILAIVALLSGIINSYFAAHVAHSFGFDLRNALFSRIQAFTMATYLKFPTSGLITRLTNDVTQVQNVLFMSLRILVRAPLAAFLSLVMAFIINPKIALFLFIGAPIVVGFLYFMVKKGITYFAQVQWRLDRVNRVLQECLQAIRLVKAYMRNQYESSRFQQVADSLRLDTTKALRIMELIMPVLLLIMNVSLLAVIWFGSNEVHAGNAQVGELVAIINYSMRVTGNFTMFAFIIIAIARAKASSDRMKEVLIVDEGGLEEQSDKKETKINSSINEIGTVRFENVSFTYPNSELQVLSNISFEVKRGEKLAIMGETGAGKTTLLNLIPRFYEPSIGNVFVNGRNIIDWSMGELRAMIGFVPQKSLLFTGSISENLKWGKQDALVSEVRISAEQAQIHETVETFPNKYETRVGQKGVNLSGGQKQRLSIARALIRKSRILVLDDSTSALDIKTEGALWEALEDENATMFVVTQKVRTARSMDKILLLHEGKVEAYGTHDELIQISTRYQQIVESQEEQVGEEG
ncbi:ABC transporter ATP-binding protein [Ureibacillus manganicus]|uniref:ABC transporter ATP-binding protein n=1 Tax=Ureibacillus manganicus DSM 26584 TaxID=1384049 RepID=A0A0A3IX33_9BACL|nr:ABC transporter ATP-binding protein [Ureibacillus manganicus]KGR79372.1 ABC transporter ATP-binding protein [Ureibacillus manganicus DSM 26584]